MSGTVFIQTNDRQRMVAEVAAYSLRRASRRPEAFDVQIMRREEHAFFDAREGDLYLRDGGRRPWRNDDLQSFTPLRFMPPELMGYRGRAVVIDPDIFAVGDVWELLSRDMHGHAIMCRKRSGPKGYIDGCLASSVMLLDCAKLTHWRTEEQFNEMFRFERDYMPWICLKLEERESIGLFENEWNDFDKLTANTKMLHNTRRKTQPWKTGLPTDWRPAERFRLFPPVAWLLRARRQLVGEYAFLGHYKRHPDPNQERLFFGLLRECMDNGIITEQMLRDEMKQNHVRHDALELLERTPPLETKPIFPTAA